MEIVDEVSARLAFLNYSPYYISIFRKRASQLEFLQNGGDGDDYRRLIG